MSVSTQNYMRVATEAASVGFIRGCTCKFQRVVTCNFLPGNFLFILSPIVLIVYTCLIVTDK